MNATAAMIQTLGEPITYVSASGASKTIYAIVDRSQASVWAMGGAALPIKTIEVRIARDATAGVTSVKAQADRLRFKDKLADAADTEYVISRVLNEDAGLSAAQGGMYHLEVVV